MARSLDQVLAELEPTYAGTRSIYQTKLDSVPGEITAGIAQADAKLGEANTNILDASRRRGLGFSGIPVGEQAKYAATEYAPAIANLKTAGKNQELGILEALQGLDRDKRTQGQSIYDNDLAREFQERQFQEQTRQFNENLAAQERQARAARAASSSDLSRYLGGGSSGAAAGPRVQQTKPGSFAFFDAGNKPITAAQYAAASGKQLGDVLFEMGQAGDRAAKSAYGILQMEARNNDGGKGYAAALKQLQQRNPYLLGGI